MKNLNLMQKLILVVVVGIIILMGLFPSWACGAQTNVPPASTKQQTQEQPTEAQANRLASVRAEVDFDDLFRRMGIAPDTPKPPPVDTTTFSMMLILAILAVVCLIFYFTPHLPWLGEWLGKATRSYKKAHKPPVPWWQKKKDGFGLFLWWPMSYCVRIFHGGSSCPGPQ